MLRISNHTISSAPTIYTFNKKLTHNLKQRNCTQKGIRQLNRVSAPVTDVDKFLDKKQQYWRENKQKTRNVADNLISNSSRDVTVCYRVARATAQCKQLGY